MTHFRKLILIVVSLIATIPVSSRNSNAYFPGGKEVNATRVPGPRCFWTDLERGFTHIPDSIKTAVYWYWVNNNISAEGVVKDLQAMKAVGINRAFIGNQGDGDVPLGRVKFGSDEWWEITRTALRTATELGIEIGFFNCPGWSQSGGPWIKESQSMRYLEACSTVCISDGKTPVKVTLPEGVPADQLVSVVAYPRLKGKCQSFKLTCETGTDFETELELDEDFPVRTLTIFPDAAMQSRMELLCDGKPVASFLCDRHNVALNVGFKPLAPVTIALPEGVSGTFTLRCVNTGKGAGFTALLSELPYVERYAEKSLAKMFQQPLPMWDEYMWTAPAVNYAPELVVDPAEVVELTCEAADGGTFSCSVPAGEWTVLVNYLRTTGVTNSPAVAEATGLEVDKMSRKHVAYHFDSFCGEIIRRIPAEERECWKVVVEDSYETGGMNWTDDMRVVFRDTYGYDPLPYLPVLQGVVVGGAEQSERFLWDLRRLIADRVAYDYVGGLRDESHKWGLETWLECYGHWGFPGEFLQYGGQSDQVAGEYWSEGTLGDIENRAASSCGHIYGKNQIWAESCTAAGYPFRRYPLLMKKRVDRFFCEGINATLLHLYIQQPDDREPGMNAWYGNEFNRHNTWWGAMDLFVSYLKRCNLMLQQGRYVADVAYFIGEDAPKMTGVCSPALPEGYSFDYINAEVLRGQAHVENGELVLNSGMRYKVLVLPDQETMRPELLSVLDTFASEGLTIVGPRPVKSPSLKDLDEGDRLVKKIAEKIWERENVVDEKDLKTVLDKIEVREDFKASTDTSVDLNVAFIHRTMGKEGDMYYVANQEEETAWFTGEFRVDAAGQASCLKAQLWNPVTGAVKDVECRFEDGAARVDFNLEPLESVFVVFRTDPENTDASKKKNAGLEETTPAEARTIELNGQWTVDFAESAGNPAFTKVFNGLGDWTASDDEAVKYYSGSACYKTTFVLTRRQARASRLTLDVGKVMVMAKVCINGQYVGGVWTSPYSLDIQDFVRPGENTIEVTVFNNWHNRLVFESALDPSSRKVWTPVYHQKPTDPLLTSGLLGPVRIDIE